MPSRPSADEAAAYLGGVEFPSLLVSELVPYFEEIKADVISPKSADQVRRWRNPYKRAADRFIALIGGKQVSRSPGRRPSVTASG